MLFKGFTTTDINAAVQACHDKYPTLRFDLTRCWQMKRSKEHRDMLGKLGKGDEVITSGGLAGVVREIGENYLTVEIADNTPVKMQKSAIVSVLPKGSLKAL